MIKFYSLPSIWYQIPILVSTPHAFPQTPNLPLFLILKSTLY